MARPDAQPIGHAPRSRRHPLRRLASAVFWAVALVLGAFGVFFSFANYPTFGVLVALALLVVLASSERRRRKRRRESARRRDRARAASS